MDFAVVAIKQWMKTQNHNDISETELLATIDSAYKTAKSKPIDIAERSDMMNAELLINAYGDDLIYVTGLGWHYWNGKVWQPDADNANVTMLFTQCMKALREETAQKMAAAGSRSEMRELAAIAQWTVKSLSASSINAAITLASKFRKVRRTTNDIDSVTSQMLLNCNNGTVNLQTGELQKHRKEDMITKIVPVDYNPGARCPFWEDTFKLIFDDNADLITFMQKALGYSLTGSVDERCFFICWGESGANGKSTILETVQDILGPGYAQMSDMVVITSSTTDNRVSSSLAKLQGSRFVSMNEAEENQKLSEALIKQMTGGDTVQACFKYQNPFEYKPIFKLWIRTNEKPIIRSQTNSIWDRIKLIPFERSIPKDKRLPRSIVDAKLIEEREGILAWLVRGAQMWVIDSSLSEPSEVSAAVSGYRSDSDIIRIFLDECAEENPQYKIKTSELYQAFVGWSRDAGERYIMPRIKFIKRVSLALNSSTSRSNGQVYLHGCKLTTQASMYVN
jgi:putative DNA primase/helicase